MPTETKPPQQQKQTPGVEAEMHPRPDVGVGRDIKAGRLKGKAAIITGGDSGIGRAVAVAFAQEGADVAIVYLNEHDDAKKTKEMVEQAGRKCVTIAGDQGDESFCRKAVEQAIKDLGRLDILVNNAAEQHPQESIEDSSADQLERPFRTNIFGYFYMTKAAVRPL